MDADGLSAEGILRSTGYTPVTGMHRVRGTHYENCT
jgi:hypothetical protein